MKGALVTFIAKVEGVVKEKFSGAPPRPRPRHFLPPKKIPGGATALPMSLSLFTSVWQICSCLAKLSIQIHINYCLT